MTDKKGRRISDPEEIAAIEAMRERLAGFPGREELELYIWRAGEEPPGPGLPDSPSNARPQTLRQFRETLGGDEGHLRSSRGDLHFVSVVKWAGEDPDKTFVKPVFTFVPDDERKAEWMDLWKEHFERFPFESGG